MGAARKLTEYQTSEDYWMSINQKMTQEKREIKIMRHQKNAHAKQILRFLRTICFLGVVFMCLAFVVFRQAQVYEAQFNVIELERGVKQLTMDLEEVKSNLDSTISLDNIERVAIQELSMQYPKPEQIVYIRSNWHYALDKKVEIEYGDNVKNELTAEKTSFVDYFKKLASKHPSSSEMKPAAQSSN